MKLEHTMKIGDDEFTVKYSYLGFEKYFLNGELIKKCWNFHFTGKRKFNISGNELVIDVSVKLNDYYCKAFLNGELFIEELFPEFKERVEQPVQPASLIKQVILILIWAAIFMVIFGKLQSYA